MSFLRFGVMLSCLGWSDGFCVGMQETNLAMPPLSLVVIATPDEEGVAEQLVRVASYRDPSALKSLASSLGFALEHHEGVFIAFSPCAGFSFVEAEIDLLWMLWQRGGSLKLSDSPSARTWCEQAISTVFKGSLDYVEKQLGVSSDHWLNQCPVDVRLRAKLSATCKIPGVAGSPKIYLEDVEFPISSVKVPSELTPHRDLPLPTCSAAAKSGFRYSVVYSESIPSRSRSELAMTAFQRLKDRQERSESKWRVAIEALSHSLYKSLSLPTTPQIYRNLSIERQNELRSRLQSMGSMFEAMNAKMPNKEQMERMEVEFKVVPVVEMQFQCDQGGWSHTIALGETPAMELRMRWFRLPERK